MQSDDGMALKYQSSLNFNWRKQLRSRCLTEEQ